MRGRVRSPRRGANVVVRDGPRGRELLVGGTFASLYRPGQVTTGSVWDALAAPVLALEPERRRRVLLLGLGGGSAARIVRAIAPQARIVAVELDPDVVTAARRWFGLDRLGLEVAIADAREFLVRERRRFDAVLDDVFIGNARSVRKPNWLPEPGLRLAAARVTPGGVLASNTIAEAPATARMLCRLFGAGVSIGVEGYHNRIVTAGGPISDARALRAAIAADPVLKPSLRSLRLRTLR